MGTQSRELVPHISVYYEITLVRIRIMGGSKIHAHMAQLFVVIHMQEFYHGFAIFFRRGLFGGYVLFSSIGTIPCSQTVFTTHNP